MGTAASYNYPHFHTSQLDLSNFPGRGVDEGARRDPEAAARNRGSAPRMARGAPPPVVEAGRITCPMYAKRVAPMRGFIAFYPGPNFIFGGLRAVFAFVVELPRLLCMHAEEGSL